MTTWLIQISFGPVQGFIASARRTRDLWGGSLILSQIAHAAGLALIKEKAKLIYPVQERVESGDQSSNLSNVLLARLDNADQAQAQRVAEAALDAGKAALEAYSDKAKQALPNPKDFRPDLWNTQIKDVLDTFAAWAEMPSEDSYESSMGKLKSSLAARKNTRDFIQMNAGDLGIPKSSLDGLRESVLPKKIRIKTKRLLGLSDGEQLDALGVIKRHVGKNETFTPLTRLAIDGWLTQLNPEQIATLRDLYEPLVDCEVATRVKGNEGIYANFPYDGGLLFPERLEKELGIVKNSADIDDATITEEPLKALQSVLRPIYKEHGKPCPYVSILVADGDRMGKFVASAKRPNEHTEISHAVSAFADDAANIMRKQRGHLVYAGGEDVMAFLPLDNCVSAAKNLSKNFNTHINRAITALKLALPDDVRPTLRVGIAIVHVLEPLGVSRQHADAAEKFAKGNAGSTQQGNALGLELHIRAGHVIQSRMKFNEPAAFDHLESWKNAYRAGFLTTRMAYDLRAVAEQGVGNGHVMTTRMAYDLRAVAEQGVGNGHVMGFGDELTYEEVKLLFKRASQASLKQTERKREQHQQNEAIWSSVEAHINSFRELPASTSTHAHPFAQSMLELSSQLILARWLAARNQAETGEKT